MDWSAFSNFLYEAGFIALAGVLFLLAGALSATLSYLAIRFYEKRRRRNTYRIDR